MVKLPCAEAGGRFTALFEALAIEWMKASGQLAVAGLLRLSWDQVHGIMERAVERGTTSSGGTYNEGILFSVAANLPPFVSLIPTRGKVGTIVGILGQGFSRATGVSFNGAPASYTVGSDTFLTALVPAHSRNGTVIVKIAAGELRSNTQFHVIRSQSKVED